eukprot:sb/3477190/
MLWSERDDGVELGHNLTITACSRTATNADLIGTSLGNIVLALAVLTLILVGVILGKYQEPIRTRYIGHDVTLTGYQPIRDQYFLIRSVPGKYYYCNPNQDPRYMSAVLAL